LKDLLSELKKNKKQTLQTNQKTPEQGKKLNQPRKKGGKKTLNII